MIDFQTIASKYPITIFYSPEDEGYIATPLDIEGCSAFGETPEQALEEVKIAINLHLETRKEKGWEIPLPFSRLQKSNKSDQPKEDWFNQYQHNG